MSKFIVTYKKECEGKVEELYVEMEAKKASGVKSIVQHNCKRESYELMERLQAEKPIALGCGNYGKDEIGVWTTKGNSSPFTSVPRKDKWILRFFDFEVKEIEVPGSNE